VIENANFVPRDDFSSCGCGMIILVRSCHHRIIIIAVIHKIKILPTGTTVIDTTRTSVIDNVTVIFIWNGGHIAIPLTIIVVFLSKYQPSTEIVKP